MPAGSRNISIDRYNINHNISTLGINKPLISIACWSPEVGSVGRLEFYPKGIFPVSIVSGEGGGFRLNYEIDRYPEIIDTLRYEKPIRIVLFWDEKGVIYRGEVYTSDNEPIGEQEGRGAPA